VGEEVEVGGRERDPQQAKRRKTLLEREREGEKKKEYEWTFLYHNVLFNLTFATLKSHE
jgi:hypothetical protein